MSNTTMIGVIGGSGIYEIDGLDGAEWVSVETPWGTPSDQVLRGVPKRCRNGVPAAPRTRAFSHAFDRALSREY